MRVTNKKKFNTFLVITMLLIALIFSVINTKANTEYTTYCVGTDENLYQIIHTLYDTQHEDYRNIQSEITRVNNINPNLLIPGQTLRIPQEGLK